MAGVHIRTISIVKLSVKAASTSDQVEKMWCQVHLNHRPRRKTFFCT